MAIQRRLFEGKGYTLIEMVIVLLLVAILAAFTLARWSAPDTAATLYAERFMADVRTLQMLAMNQGKTLTLQVRSDGYDIKDGGTVIDDPVTGDPFSITFEYGVSLLGDDLDFDIMGRPLESGALITGYKVFVFSGGGYGVTVRLHPLTGFVEML